MYRLTTFAVHAMTSLASFDWTNLSEASATSSLCTNLSGANENLRNSGANVRKKARKQNAITHSEVVLMM